MYNSPAVRNRSKVTASLPETEPGHRLHPWWFLSAILLLAGGLRLYSLATSGIFIDEIFSIFVATNTGDPELARIDAVRPVYFALLKAWMLISTSEIWMKLLSVLFSLGSIVVTYMLGCRVAGKRAGLAAALVMALSPMEIYYGQLVRMYAMGTFLVLAGSMSLTDQWDGSSRRKAAGWVVTRLLMVLTVPLTATMLAADGVNCWMRRAGTRLLTVFAVGSGLIFLSWLPFSAKLLSLSASRYDAWRDTLAAPPLTDFLRFIVNLSCTAFPEHKGPPVDDLLSALYVLMVPCLLVMGIAAASDKPKLRWCAVWALLPLCIMFVYSHIANSVFAPRYLMFVSPFLFILMAAGWQALWENRRRAGILAAVIYLVTITNCLSFSFANPVSEDWHKIAKFFAEHEQPGDIIALTGKRIVFPMRYCYRGESRIHNLIVKARSDGNTIYDLAVSVEGLGAEDKRIWLVSRQVPRYRDFRDKLYRVYQEKVADTFRVLEHHKVTGMDIYLVEPL